jgi:AAA+ superfamily predicted ATPase
MPVDRTQLELLERALAESPDNVGLRMLIGSMHGELMPGPSGTQHARAALAHAQAVLVVEPDHREALALAAAAATATGDRDLATRYQRLADALAGAPTEPPTTAPLTQDVPGSGPRRPAQPADDPAGSASHPSRFDPDPLFDGAAPAGGVVWSADGSHDDIEGESPLWVSISDALDGDEHLEIISEIDIPHVRLDDVGGLETVKQRLRTSFLAPLENPELREMYRKSLRGGMLLYGPPGCGKTFLARAVAGELRARFFAIGLHDVLDMYVGNSEKNLHEIFETARRHAPCVLFLDEVDALGHKRSNFTQGAGGRNIVVQLLNELDGLQGQNEGLFVIAATNQPWDIDAALRRPGRLDRMLLVLPPDEPAREAILQYHLRDRPVAPNIDLAKVASRTNLYSGADLRLVCEAAAEAALEDSLAAGRARPITAKDLERAVKETVPSTRAWFEVAKNFAQFANEGGRYDDLLGYMRANRLA